MARRMAMGMRGASRRFFGNFGLKVLALVIAAALWFIVTAGREATCELTVPVEVVGLADGFVINGTVPSTAMVRVAGRRLDLYRLRPADFKVTVNLSGKEAGIHRVDLQPSNVVYTGTKRLRVEGVVSEKILMLELERRVTKTVPVKVIFSGQPAPGYYLGLPEVEPPRATLYGSAQTLEKITALSVVADAEGKSEDFVAKCNIRPPAGITLVGTGEATVRTPVRPGERRTFAGVKVVVTDGGYDPSPDRATLTLEGEVGRLAALKGVVVYVTSQGPDAGRVRVEVPDYTKLISLSPLEVQLLPRAGK